MFRKCVLIPLAIVTLISSSVLFLSCNGRKNGNSGGGKVRVAAILALTGPAARFDAVKQQALSVAMKRLTALNPHTPMEMEVYDGGGGPEATNVAIRKALDWGASYLLSGTSPTALAIAAQVRGRSPVIVQMANAATPDFGPPRPGEYRFWPDWKQEAETVVGILKGQGITSALLIHSADPYSEALTKELREQTSPITGFRMQDLQFDPAATPDFRPALLRAKQDRTQALIVFGLPPGINALMAQLAEVQWDRTLIGGVNINLSVSAYDSARLTGPLWLVETEAMRDELPVGSEANLFRAQYKQENNENPAFHSLYLADALYFIADAWNKNSDPNTAEVDRLKQVRNFNGPSGQIGVNEDGTLQFVMSARKAR